MKELLFLCHRMPYPPNKGDKIRAFHLLQALTRDYRVHLATFVDDAHDWQYRDTLDSICAEQCYRPLVPRTARLRSLTALFQSLPLSFAYYYDRALAQWITELMRRRPIAVVVVFSSAMAPYVRSYPEVRRVLDFVDVDSEKWRQYAAHTRAPMRWVYAREARQLLAGERRLAATFDASVFVSQAEADLFCERAPECASRVTAIGNGVDSDYFAPAGDYADPYGGHGARTMVFTGVMDYGANIDAVTWFVDSVFPIIRAQMRDAEFCIVGTRPARPVMALAQRPGVRVTGAVADVRPYLAHARLAVAPMRIARGLQNKVLEALAMGKPMVMTPQAATGLQAFDNNFAGVAESADALACQALRFLSDTPSTAVARMARDYVVNHYGWQRQLADFLALVADEKACTGPSSADAAQSRGDSRICLSST